MGETAELSFFPVFETLDLSPATFDDISAGFASPEPDAFLIRCRSTSGTVFGFDSDTESGGEQIDAPAATDLEWEEIDARPTPIDDGGTDHGGIVTGNIDWEVLLNVSDAASSVDEHEDFVYTSDYEVLFGQFADHELSLGGCPPAAKSAVESLPSIELSKSDACAVCKDEIQMEEHVTQLPCSHHYHGECILPWLVIRNTCPVCRYELPTDDAEYEKLKARRVSGGGGGAVEAESRPRYDFGVLYED